MTIGENIRRLRRERDITQEGLADLLGISAQAVSGWENGRTCPDISQLAPLANIFEVSADVILGIDIDNKNQRIEELYKAAYETACTGDYVKAILMAEEALREFPDSHKLMAFYADEIYLYNYMAPEENRETNKKRALGYLDILRTSPNDSIRYQATETTCLWYQEFGRTAEAEALAKSLAHTFTAGELLSRIYKGTQQFEVMRDELVSHFIYTVGYGKDMLLEAKYDDGTSVYTDDEKLALEKMSVEMLQMFIPDGDYYFYAQYFEIAWRGMAMIYAKRHDRANTLRCVKEAAKMAVHFDTYQAGTTHTSLLLRGMEADGRWLHDQHNRSFDLIERLKKKDYAFLKDDDEMKAVIAELETYAK